MKARVQIVQVFIDCPHCKGGGVVDSYTGSYLHDALQLGSTVTCQECGQVLDIPQWVFDHTRWRGYGRDK